jgi:hypothetical protein
MKLLAQSYLVCFKDEHVSFSSTLDKLFKGEFTRDLDSADFIACSDPSVLHMKYVILHSLRMAFHYSQEALIMGEFDVPPHQDLEVTLSLFIKYIERTYEHRGRMVLGRRGLLVE